nr:R3H domain-containing nucleic acid-binding protein [Acidipropionibacterium acidipropionici]
MSVMSEESVDTVVDEDSAVVAVEVETEESDVEPEPVEEDSDAASEDSEEDEDSDDDESDEPADPLEEEGDIAADYLEELLDIADLDGDIDTYVEGSRAHISIVTESQTLVGNDGKVLEALQELSRLAVMTETGHRSRLMLDVAGYRETRRKELLILATEAIEAVKETGEPAHLAPMNPFERKIVHDAAAAAGLTSESEGVEPKRHVVISKD